MADGKVTYGSCFSGVGSCALASKDLGWEPAFFCETAPFPSAVLKHRWPSVPNLGDIFVVAWAKWNRKIDVMVGGPPCQSFSVAGQRGGLSDPRGNLSLAWVEVLDAVDPVWSVTENVPGWLSSADNAFGVFLAGLVGAGVPALVPGRGQRWGDAGVVAGPKRVAAWRVLDAQHFGVPQRRRRVFVVAGDPRRGADPTKVLLESKGVQGDLESRGAAREEVAGTLGKRLGRSGDELDGHGAYVEELGVVGSVTRKWAKGTGGPAGDECQNIVVATRLAHALRAEGFTCVRRLTPTECERLQGMPDGQTLVPYRHGAASDGPRYAAIGNAWAVPVARWVFTRINRLIWGGV